MKLFMLLLGCQPPGRNTEQHDVFFGIGNDMIDLLPAVFDFWPEAKPKIHLDAWREVTTVDGFAISVIPRNQLAEVSKVTARLFFLNLGGYKQGEFEEFHYKMLVACNTKAEAIQKAKETVFFKHTGFKGAHSHIDEKYGVDVDDIYEIEDILPVELKKNYRISLEAVTNTQEDESHLGYVNLVKLMANKATQ